MVVSPFVPWLASDWQGHVTVEPQDSSDSSWLYCCQSDPEEFLPVATWELGKMEGKELLGLAHLIFFYRFFLITPVYFNIFLVLGNSLLLLSYIW